MFDATICFKRDGFFYLLKLNLQNPGVKASTSIVTSTQYCPLVNNFSLLLGHHFK